MRAAALVGSQCAGGHVHVRSVQIRWFMLHALMHAGGWLGDERCLARSVGQFHPTACCGDYGV